MFSKTILAVATTLVLGVAALAPTAASAKHFGGPGFHGFHGGWGHGWRGYGWRGGFGVALVGPSCYDYRTVLTPVGPRVRLVNICY
jgi:hypothetical protein